MNLTVKKIVKELKTPLTLFKGPGNVQIQGNWHIKMKTTEKLNVNDGKFINWGCLKEENCQGYKMVGM